MLLTIACSTNNEAPRCIKGHAITLALVGMSGVLYAILWVAYARINKARDWGKIDPAQDGLSEEEMPEGGRKPVVSVCHLTTI